MINTRSIGFFAVALLVAGGIYIFRGGSGAKQFDQLSKAKNLINDGKFEDGLTIYTELSKMGVETATYSVAQIYSEGWGVPRDHLKAEEFLKIYTTQADRLCGEVPKIAAAYQLMARDHRDPDMKRMWRKKALDAGYIDSKCPPSYAFPE